MHLNACKMALFICVLHYSMLTIVTRVNITIVTFLANNRDGFDYPLRPAFDVIFSDLAYRYPKLHQNGSVTRISLYYTAISESNGLNSNAQMASEVDVLFEFYYANQHLFTADYSERFTALIVDSKGNGVLNVLKNFVKGTHTLLAGVNPQENATLERELNPSWFNCEVVPSLGRYYFAIMNAFAEKFNWPKRNITIFCNCIEAGCDFGFHADLCQSVTTDETVLNTSYYELWTKVLRWTPPYDSLSDLSYWNGIEFGLEVARQTQSYVILLLVQSELVRKIMILAHGQGMTVDDTYMFMTVQLPANTLPDQFLSWKANDANDTVAAIAFNSVVFVTKKRADQNQHMTNLNGKIVGLYSELNRTAPIPKDLMDFRTIELLDTVPVIFQALDQSFHDLMSSYPEKFIKDMSNQSYNTTAGIAHIDSLGSMVSPLQVFRFDPFSRTMKVVFEIDPLSGDIVDKNESSYVHNWHPRDRHYQDFGPCGESIMMGYTECIWLREQLKMLAETCTAVCLLFILTFLMFLWIRKKRSKMQRLRHLFIDIQTVIPMLDEDITSVNDSCERILGTQAEFGSIDVYTKIATSFIDLQQATADQQLSATLLEIQNLKHQNIGLFYGITIQNKRCFLCGEYGERGSLDSLHHLRSALDDDLRFRLSFMADVIEGLAYIHKSSIKYHGMLTDSVCLVTSRFVVKIAHAGYEQLSHLLMTGGTFSLNQTKIKTVSDRNNQAADIQNAGFIFHKLITQPDRFTQKDCTGADGWNKLDVSLTPDSAIKELERMIKSCLDDNWDQRPHAVDLQKIIRKYVEVNFNITSLLMYKLEQQAALLETVVLERTADLIKETENVDLLLQEILPPSIIKQLRNHVAVKAELFESATILFSDIPSFPDIASMHTPCTVVQFLNEIYTVFDLTVAKFNAYKVETISDSYVVTSGIPVLNGISHASEICALSLCLRDAGKAVVTPVTDIFGIGIRIGINSGTIAAGIVGTRMPRYCLFGDAMNIASRMESHGQEGRIHVSAATKQLTCSLDHKRFHFECRGFVYIKGKGDTETYWLLRTSDDMN